MSDNQATTASPEIVEPKTAAERSAAIANTWTDPAIKAARSVRNRVTVDGVEYRSVLAAFKALDLQVSRHVPFRQKLKASETGKANFQVEGNKPGTVVDFLFTIVPADEEAPAAE